MATILLSIKPEYSRKIFDGTKKYEYRKRLAKRRIDKIVVYSSSPIQKVIGEVAVNGILSMNPTLLWEYTKGNAGISTDKYQEYFSGYSFASAYELGKTTLYKAPKSLSEYGIKQPPQSFIYLD